MRAGLEAGMRHHSRYAAGLARAIGEGEMPRRQEMVIGGYTEPRGARKASARCCSAYTDRSFFMPARSAPGSTPGRSRPCIPCCARSARHAGIFESASRPTEGAHWVNQCGEVAFTNGATTGAAASVLPGLRADKAQDVRREDPMSSRTPRFCQPGQYAKRTGSTTSR